MGELVPRSQLTKSFLNGVGGIGAGVGLLIVSSLVASAPAVLWVAVGVCGVIGAGMAISKTQKKAGIALLGAAALGAVAAIGSGLLGWLVPVAGIGLIALGGFSLFKFFTNMKKRT